MSYSASPADGSSTQRLALPSASRTAPRASNQAAASTNAPRSTAFSGFSSSPSIRSASAATRSASSDSAIWVPARPSTANDRAR